MQEKRGYPQLKQSDLIKTWIFTKYALVIFWHSYLSVTLCRTIANILSQKLRDDKPSNISRHCCNSRFPHTRTHNIRCFISDSLTSCEARQIEKFCDLKSIQMLGFGRFEGFFSLAHKNKNQFWNFVINWFSAREWYPSLLVTRSQIPSLSSVTYFVTVP